MQLVQQMQLVQSAKQKFKKMNEYKYILEPYKGMSTRYHCPECQSNEKTFSLYIDTETGEHLNNIVGRCNRESKCGYHYTPKQYFQDNNISFDTNREYKLKKFTPQQKPVSFIPIDVFKASLKEHETNNFVVFLINLFGVDITNELISRYFLATSKHWYGATVFWQIDTKGKVRTGKIMLYNATTGKRIKEPFNHIYWVHKALKQPEFELKQCLFGEHLLKGNTKPVAIVESEKTAIISSVYLPQFIWLAVGSLTNLNAEKCSILKGRTVTLFPDLNGFEKWSNKAKELSHITNFNISDLLERKASEAEKEQGFDLADYLIKFDYKEFAKVGCSESEQAKKTDINFVQNLNEVKPIQKVAKIETLKPENWEKEIKELQTYFSGLELPTQPIKLNQFSTITNASKFIDSHLATIKANNGKRTFLPHLNRLQELKKILTINLN